MAKPNLSIVDQLRDYDNCPDGVIDEAADMLAFLLERFQSYSPKMDGQHSWRFRNAGWPMTYFKGPSVEEAIRNAMAEVDRVLVEQLNRTKAELESIARDNPPHQGPSGDI